MKTKLFFRVVTVLLSLSVATLACAQSSQSLINPASFRGPAADQRAYRVGDILTVYVLETTRARSQAATDSDRSSGFAADLSTPSTNYNGSIVLQGKSKGAAQTSRIGELRAQLTVRVVAVEANGLMRIQGTQILEVNKEQQKITLSGLVRPEDISAGNIVWSTRIADAQVSLAGKGIVSEAQRKSLISRVFTWLGLL
ncbi:MAG: flagellar basal body L-ring protein FlgH [Arenimonas sp.]